MSVLLNHLGASETGQGTKSNPSWRNDDTPFIQISYISLGDIILHVAGSSFAPVLP